MATKKMTVSLALATAADVPALISLHRQVAEDLDRRYGPGPWSPAGTYSERPLVYDLSREKFVRILVARQGRLLAGTLRLQTKKPWAIDTAYFSPARRPLYLSSMAVLPRMQGKGIGRRLLQEAVRLASAWPGDAIRLDSYDADAGAGGFYAKCGYREVGRVSYRGVPHLYFELQL